MEVGGGTTFFFLYRSFNGTQKLSLLRAALIDDGVVVLKREEKIDMKRF